MKFDKNEKLIIILILIIAMLLSAIVLVLFWVKGIEKQSETGKNATLYQTTTPVETTQLSTEFSIETHLTDNVSDNEAAFTQQEPQIKVPVGKNALVDEYNRALTMLKNSSDFKLNTTSRMNIQVNEITGGTIAERILQSFINDTNKSLMYDFKNGSDANSGKTPYGVLPPANQTANLQPNQVLSANVLSSSANGYTVKFTLADETVSTNQTPGAHLICLPELSMNMEDSAFTIDSYNVTFSDSTIVAKYDSNGRLIYIENITRSPGMTCDGTASVVPLHVSMYGDITSVYSIVY